MVLQRSSRIGREPQLELDFHRVTSIVHSLAPAFLPNTTSQRKLRSPR
jgi:hypothetical protein